MNLKRTTVELYARGSAPFAAIPLPGIGAIVFRRGHLQAALATEPNRIIYNADTKTVTFRTSRSEWKLNDLLGQQKIQQWQLREQLSAWAHGKRSGTRKRKETAALGKHGGYVRKLRQAIAKLKRQRDKISLQRPQHPLLHQRWAEAGNYGRDAAQRWADEKPIRAALAKLAGRKLLHGEPKTWADFYQAVEAISGHPVSESATFSRVHGRKRYRHGVPDYPDREDYLKALPTYLVMATKPWDRRPYDLYKKDQYGEQLNALERHAQARCEYCAALRERMALDSQIAAHEAEIASVSNLVTAVALVGRAPAAGAGGIRKAVARREQLGCVPSEGTDGVSAENDGAPGTLVSR